MSASPSALSDTLWSQLSEFVAERIGLHFPPERRDDLKRGLTSAAVEFGFADVQAKARVPLKDAAHVSSLKSRVVHDLQVVFGESEVSITYGYETTYKRLQVLDLPKSHTNDAVAIACEISEVIKPLKMVIRSAV